MKRCSLTVFFVLFLFVFSCFNVFPEYLFSALADSTSSDKKAFYGVPLSDVNISLYLPESSKYIMTMDDPNQKSLLITIPDSPETFYAFFAIKSSDIENEVAFSELDDKQMVKFIRHISNLPEKATYEVDQNFFQTRKLCVFSNIEMVPALNIL